VSNKSPGVKTGPDGGEGVIGFPYMYIVKPIKKSEKLELRYEA
jgi:hypothetical protein